MSTSLESWWSYQKVNECDARTAAAMSDLIARVIHETAEECAKRASEQLGYPVAPAIAAAVHSAIMSILKPTAADVPTPPIDDPWDRKPGRRYVAINDMVFCAGDVVEVLDNSVPYRVKNLRTGLFADGLGLDASSWRLPCAEEKVTVPLGTLVTDFYSLNPGDIVIRQVEGEEVRARILRMEVGFSEKWFHTQVLEGNRQLNIVEPSDVKDGRVRLLDRGPGTLVTEFDSLKVGDVVRRETADGDVVKARVLLLHYTQSRDFHKTEVIEGDPNLNALFREDVSSGRVRLLEPAKSQPKKNDWQWVAQVGDRFTPNGEYVQTKGDVVVEEALEPAPGRFQYVVRDSSGREGRYSLSTTYWDVATEKEKRMPYKDHLRWVAEVGDKFRPKFSPSGTCGVVTVDKVRPDGEYVVSDKFENSAQYALSSGSWEPVS